MEVGAAASSRGEATADYLRRARRVRARFGHDPVRMHRELRGLWNGRESQLESAPRVRRVVSRLPEALPLQSHQIVAQAFAGDVERAIEGGVLRYSQRAHLLRRARAIGIGRFEANLIIATVQHRRSIFADDVPAVTQLRTARQRWWQAALAFVVAQALIVLAVWWVWPG
jgi:hypothetical protein